MHVLIVTDSFPPGCGGSGWSTFELTRGLQDLGHRVTVVLVRAGPDARTGIRSRPYEDVEIREYAVRVPAVPYLRNYLKNERLTRRLARYLTSIVAEAKIDLAHGQHVLSCPPAVRAAEHTGIPVVCTVRDYWPVCYWSDLIHDPHAETLCPDCSPRMMARCIRPRAGALWPMALPFVPYMRGNLQRKQRTLASARAVIAVSSTIAADLRRRGAGLGTARIETIPNPVNVEEIRRQAQRLARPLTEPYAIYVGKLAVNKGSARLIDAVAGGRLSWPLVVVGDGPLRDEVERQAARSGVRTHFTGWLSREETLGWLRHASLLVFPSHGPESLSRVLLEGSVLGVPIAAMDTGGTRDIIEHERTGLLSHSTGELARDVGRLAADPALRDRLGAAAAREVTARFDTPGVARRVDALYRELVAAAGREPDPRRAGKAAG